MLRCLFIVCLFSVASNLFARYENVQGRLRVKSNVKKISIGDTTRAILLLWPVESGHEKELVASIRENNFLDAFYIVDIIDAKRNENNIDVLEVEMMITSTKKIASEQLQIWTIDKENIPIEINSIEIVGDIKPTEDAIVVDIEKNDNRSWFAPVVSILGILLLLLIFYGRKKVIARRLEREKLKKLNSWKKTFNSAKRRKDYENIYNKRLEWEKYITSDKSLVKNFYQTINKHQYKKTWESFESNDTKESFDKIRHILNNGI